MFEAPEHEYCVLCLRSILYGDDEAFRSQRGAKKHIGPRTVYEALDYYPEGGYDGLLDNLERGLDS